MVLGKPWSCVLDSFSLVTGIPATEFLKYVGHDGSEMLELPNSDGKYLRGFSTDELVFASLQLGWATIDLPINLRLCAHYWPTHYTTGRNLAKEYLDKHPLDCYVICTFSHAFGYKNGQVLDPAKRIVQLPDFNYLSVVYCLKKLV